MTDGLPAVVPPGQGCLAGLGVHPVVVDRLDPRGEQRVELEQRRGRGESSLGQLFGGGVGDLDEELLAHAAKPPLDLAAALRAVRGGVDQPDAELAAGPQQPGVDEGAAVVDVDAGRDTPRGEGGLQRGGQAHGVLGEPEPVPDGQPAVIVEEGEQVGLAAPDAGAVQRVTDPAFVRCRGFEPAEHARLVAGGRAHQIAAVEQPQQRRFRRRPAPRGAQDPHDLRGGTVGVLLLERRRQFQHGGVDAAAGLAGRRRERVEPTGAVAADPTVQRVAGVAVLPAERPGVGARGDRPHHPPAGLGRQVRVQRGADQLVAEQRHLLRPRPPRRVVVLLVPGHKTSIR